MAASCVLTFFDFFFFLLQGSSERLGKHPPLPVLGCGLLHDWTFADGGPHPLPRLLLVPAAAHRRLPVRSAGAHPLRGLQRRADTLRLHGCADPNIGGGVCLNFQGRETDHDMLSGHFCDCCSLCVRKSGDGFNRELYEECIIAPLLVLFFIGILTVFFIRLHFQNVT